MTDGRDERLPAGAADGLSLPSDSIVWRSLCFLALVVSIVAAITTNLSRSQDTANRIATSESKADRSRTLVEFGQLPVGEAAQLHQQYVTRIPWVEERAPLGPHAPRPAWGPPGPPPGWAAPGSRPPPPPRQPHPDHPR